MNSKLAKALRKEAKHHPKNETILVGKKVGSQNMRFQTILEPSSSKAKYRQLKKEFSR